MTRIQNQRQTVVAFTESLGHFALTNAIEEIVDQYAQCDYCHYRCHFPYPFRDTRFLAVWIEPLVLDRLQSIRSTQTVIYTINLLQQTVVL